MKTNAKLIGFFLEALFWINLHASKTLKTKYLRSKMHKRNKHVKGYIDKQDKDIIAKAITL